MTPWMLHRSRSTASAARGPLSSFAIPLSFFSSFLPLLLLPPPLLCLFLFLPPSVSGRAQAFHTAAEDRVYAPGAGTAAAAAASAGELVGVLRPPSLLPSFLQHRQASTFSLDHRQGLSD